MNFQELKSRDIAELRTLAAQMGLRTHPRHKADTIAKLIVEAATAPPKQDPMKHVAELPKEPARLNTADEINAVCAPYLKKENFIIEYPGDDTWIMKYIMKTGRVGREESGHMSVPLRVIKRKAESVAAGPIAPRAIQDVMHGGSSDLVLMVG